MHPAFSVLFLTTFIGVGQGLFLALYTAQLYSLWGLLAAPVGRDFYAVGSLIAVAWLGAGLIASFFHLGHPERGWRAITRWPSSWLSREVIVLPIFIVAVAGYGLIHWLEGGPLLIALPGNLAFDVTLVVGAGAMTFAFLLFLCTGMIYADVHLLQEWHHWLTVINFLLLGTASGFTCATVLAALLVPALTVFFATWAIVLILTAALFRGAALIRNQHLRRRSTLRSAIGVRHHHIAQKAQGFMGESFNTREFFHGHSPRFIEVMGSAFLLLGFVLPVALLFAAWWYANTPVALLAFLVQLLGLIAERWYFFAQACHPQNLYYQSVA